MTVTATPLTLSKRVARRLEHGDAIFRGLTVLASLLILLAVAAIGYELWQN
ncbi:MAG: hypothetical protein HY782_01490 [Chloroflexi bacterium]|nr:hypothetical protein [Chloroflexota bacterium]